MTADEIQKKADEQRVIAKRLFGEATGQGGYLNPEMPVSKFVDAIIATAVLEVTAIHAKAREGL
jgi:hypothetical protein